MGYDLYCQMVTEAVASLKGEELPRAARRHYRSAGRRTCRPRYVTRESTRPEAYRRLAGIETEAALDDVRAEWLDRFGPIPEPAEALLRVARLRVECVRTGVREISVNKGPGFGGPDHVARVAPVVLPECARSASTACTPGKGAGNAAVYKEAVQELQLPLRKKNGPVVEQLVEILADLLPGASRPSSVPADPVSAPAGR
ncbi:MAG: TRCF domain-containing protein [Acidimicrobiales bacterium]